MNAQATNAEITQMMGNQRYQQSGPGQLAENTFVDTKYDTFSPLRPVNSN